MAWHERDYNQDQFRGGRMMGGVGGPSVVMWLLGINVVVFLLDAVLGGSQRGSALAPFAWGNFNFDQAGAQFQVWRWITYQFVHGGFMHILGNMIILYFFGPLMEQWWGSRRFLAFYLLCGMSGAAVYTLFALVAPGVIFDMQLLERVGRTPTSVQLVGASGACFGILIGCAVLYPKQRVMLLIPPIPMSMRTLAMFVLGIMAISLIAGAQNAGGEAAHLGGAALGWLLVKKPNFLNFADAVSGFGDKVADMKLKQMHRAAQKQRQQEADEQARVDAVLDKVRDHGLASLTAKEKQILQRATDRQRGS